MEQLEKNMRRPELSIIVVDDLQFSRVVVKTALKKAGYDGVRLADSAAVALKMLDEKPADVVLADWMMPEMDGLELTQKIRQRDEEKGIYTAIILFTAHDEVEYLVKAFDHGVDDFLRKPPIPEELTARVSAAARIATLHNDLFETSRQLQKQISHLESINLTDTLTGAGNQRLLKNELKSHLLEAATRTGGVVLAMVEIDKLGQLLKDHGAFIVAEILVSLYRRLRRAVRPTDTIARLDNNVFGIMMHHSDLKNYKTTAIDRIFDGIKQRPFTTKDGNLDLSAIVGVHYFKGGENMISVDEIMENATNNLNKARNNHDGNIVYSTSGLLSNDE